MVIELILMPHEPVCNQVYKVADFSVIGHTYSSVLRKLLIFLYELKFHKNVTCFLYYPKIFSAYGRMLPIKASVESNNGSFEEDRLV